MAEQKKKRNPGAKGGQWEREVCVQLSQWWTGMRRDDIFWRSHSSGARATSRSKRSKTTKGQYGDICATDPSGEPLIDLLTIELKRGYTKDTIQDLLDRLPPNVFDRQQSAQQKLEAFIQKAEESHEAAGSFSWLLLLRRGRREPLVIMPHHFANHCIRLEPIPSFHGLVPVRYYEKVSKKKFKYSHTKTHRLFGMLWNHFLDRVTPQRIMELSERL